MRFTFEVAGYKQLNQAMLKFADEIQDFTPAFEDISEDFKKVEKRQFESEGKYGSGGWKPLSPNYRKWKEKFHPGKKILVLSGLMEESLTDENPYTINEIQPKSFTFGTRINYALFHQTGTSRMPARPPIQLSEADKTRWMKILQEYAVKKSRQSFSGLMPDIKRGEKAIRSI